MIYPVILYGAWGDLTVYGDCEINKKGVALGSPAVLCFIVRLVLRLKRSGIKWWQLYLPYVTSHPSQSTAAQGEKRHPVDV